MTDFNLAALDQDRRGRRWLAVRAPWKAVDAVLGHPYTGLSDDDALRAMLQPLVPWDTEAAESITMMTTTSWMLRGPRQRKA